MTSFKTRLVAYFLLLSLLPIVAAFWSFSSVSRRSENRSVDVRLQSGLRAAAGSLEDELRDAGAAAAALAGDRRVQLALRDRDRRALRRAAAAYPELRVDWGLSPAGARTLAAGRRVTVLLGRRVLGVVTVSVPLDDRLVRHLLDRSGLRRGDALAVVRDGLVAAGPQALRGGAVGPPSGTSRVESIGGTRYRTLVTDPLSDTAGVSLAALSPQGAADAAASANERRLLLGLTASLVLIGLVAYVLSRTVVGRVQELTVAAEEIAGGSLDRRVPEHGRDELAQLGRSFNDMATQLELRVGELEEERRRLQDATGRFGEALAATHDPDGLRALIVETAVEATGAAGGALVSDEGDVLVGRLQERADRIELPLLAGRRSFGRVVLDGDGFTNDDRETAVSFAAQAVIALENVRLHRLVEHQALVDPLTGLGNRRAFEDAVRGELARAARSDRPLGLILADLDRFKQVNDTFGHPVGDTVLREFANVIRETIRDADLAGRFGGEEFAILLPGSDLEGADQLAERIRAALEARTVLVHAGRKVLVTASFGVAAGAGTTGRDALVAAADEALYRAKRDGRNRVCVAATPAEALGVTGETS